MRFVVTGEWTRNRLLAAIVGCFLVYTALFWITNALLYFHSMGLTYDSVVAHYLGDEASFRQPRTYRGLLEVAHFHLFAMGVLLLTLTHLVLFVPLSPRHKAWLIVVSFASALGNEASGWLVRFLHPGFAYAKILCFLVLQTSLLLLMGLSGWALLAGARSSYADTDPSRKPGKSFTLPSMGAPHVPGGPGS